MINQGKSTLQFPVKTAVYNANDLVVFVYGADTANLAAPNNIAQTSIITLGNVANALAPILEVTILPSDPAHSSSLPVTAGQIFATSNFLYIADSNGHLVRTALSSF